MTSIFEFGRIQVKGEIVRIVPRIRHEGRQTFRDQEHTCLHNWRTW